ncbi:MAG: extracellular solute-binding protein [Clostridiales bacterium]|nr:extracellular solute-binding protein [Clostridiales bacterium]
MKKLLAMVLAMAMVLSVCSFSLAEGDVEITWAFWDDLVATDDLITKGYAEVIDRFNAADNGYKVVPITTNLEEYDSKVAALISGKQAPDVWICNPGPNMDVYVEADLVMPLNDILAANPEWNDSFSGGIFERMTYDGQIMAVPTNFAAACCFYNTEMFATAGVEVPTTFDELLVACQKLQDAGFQPITCSAGTPWCLSMVAGYLADRCGGPDNLTAVSEGTSTWLSEPSYTTAANKLLELSKYFQKTCASDTNDECVAQFYNEQAAILVQGSWVIAQINGAVPEFEEKCGVFQFPGVEGGADPNRMIVKTDNLLVSKNTKNVDACVELLKYFTDETAQKYTAEVGGKIPVTGVEIDFEKAPKQLSFVNEILGGMTGTLGFYNESLASVEAGDVFDNAMVSIVLGQKTVEQALTTINNHYEDEVWE